MLKNLISEIVSYNYRRRIANNKRETWHELCIRTIDGLAKLGKFTEEEKSLVFNLQSQLKSLASGRWLWVGGTDWVDKPENFAGAYNCTSQNIIDWTSFGSMMNFAMQGSGTGAVLEPKYIDKLPTIRNFLDVEVIGEIGSILKIYRQENTSISRFDSSILITVGDSRKGWVKAYQSLLEFSSDESLATNQKVIIDVSHVRPSGEPLVSFGGVANPAKLPEMFPKIAAILNTAIGRKLNSLECCLLIDEAATVVVAGSIRRSAGMRQFHQDDNVGSTSKDNLWQQDDQGNWKIDPKRDALRMANHTRVFHRKPTEQECIDAVRKQYYSGEGAIQWAGEAIARSNADLLDTPDKKRLFLRNYEVNPNNTRAYLYQLICEQGNKENHRETIEHRLQRYGLNPCGEIEGSDFFCNLSEVHLNMLNPHDKDEQYQAFKAATLSVAALLHHNLSALGERYQKSRELDPIVGVSFTGLFDFFVHLLGRDWLEWWQNGRPDGVNNYKQIEQEYLTYWQSIVKEVLSEYCTRHGLKMPNRYTTVQPAGSKSLLTGSCSGWHPPIASNRFIRRVTRRKNDPVALAAIAAGYTVVPSQSDKDSQGNLLENPFDPRCTEWLIEIPCKIDWADIADGIDFNFSALAQFDFYMQVQQHYTTHNTSATIMFKENEIEPLGKRIYSSIATDEGYISSALLARFEESETFPRLPFEPISKEHYEQMNADIVGGYKLDFESALLAYDDNVNYTPEVSACEGTKCELKF